MVELHGFFYVVVRHSALLRKFALNVEDFYVKTIGWGLKKKKKKAMFLTINAKGGLLLHVTDLG